MTHFADWHAQSIYDNLAQELPTPLHSADTLPPAEAALFPGLPADQAPTDDALSVVGLALLILLAYFVLNGIISGSRTAPPESPPPPLPTVSAPPLLPDPNLVVAPYAEYWVTQGVHGSSYGHMAIDIAAGKGSTILSPIHGEVTAVYTDEYGNPTLIIENSRYTITLLHGFYNVVVGQQLTAGDPVGSEGNLGYTTDMAGNRCQTSECGYHTHLNVYDKQLGSNVNPLNLLP